MKKTSKHLLNFWHGALLAAAMTLTSGLFNTCQAQPSPVGTWDCVINGSRQGTAYIQFLTNGSFTVYEVIVPNKPTPSNPNARNDGGEETRGGSSSNNVPGEQIFGTEFVTNGMWGFDSQGRTIGSFAEISALERCTTNSFAFATNSDPSSTTLYSPPFTNVFSELLYTITTTISTNIDLTYFNQTVFYTNLFECSSLTNAVSFVGKVTPNKRITLNCSTPFGNTLYKGVPAQVLPDISGDWYANDVQAGVKYVEFFSMIPTGVFPNTYFVSLQGPGYSYLGDAILSSQKKLSFGLGRIPNLPTEPVTIVRAVTGPFSGNKIQASTKGWDQNFSVLTNRAFFTPVKSR